MAILSVEDREPGPRPPGQDPPPRLQPWHQPVTGLNIGVIAIEGQREVFERPMTMRRARRAS